MNNYKQPRAVSRALSALRFRSYLHRAALSLSLSLWRVARARVHLNAPKGRNLSDSSEGNRSESSNATLFRIFALYERRLLQTVPPFLAQKQFPPFFHLPLFRNCPILRKD